MRNQRNIVHAAPWLIAGVLLAATGLLVVGAATPAARLTVTSTPPPLSPSPLAVQDGEERLQALAAAVHEENLAWDNVTFWQGGMLGDPALAGLRLAVVVGERFPEFTLPLLQGGQARLADFSGPLLLNFWASWCEPCRLELPYLLEIHADPQAPFSLLLLNQWESDADYRVFAEQTFPPALAVGRAPDALIGRAGIQGIPVSVLLDAEQRVVAVHVGNLTGAVVDMLYVLAEPAAGNAAQDAGTGLSTGTATPAGLQSLAEAAGQADLAGGATTLWAGGRLGVQEEVDLAIAVGDKLPAFGLMARDGRPFQLDLVGEPVLVNFWASWCEPCKVEFPLLIAADDDPGSPFRVVFVNIWDEPHACEEFLAGYPGDIPVLIDSGGALPALYGLEYIPVSILMDAEGIVLLIQRGPLNPEVLALAVVLVS